MIDTSVRLPPAQRVLDHLEQLVSSPTPSGATQSSVPSRPSWSEARSVDLEVDALQHGRATAALVDHMGQIGCLVLHITWSAGYTRVDFVDSAAAPARERQVVEITLTAAPSKPDRQHPIMRRAAQLGAAAAARLRGIWQSRGSLLLVSGGSSDRQMNEAIREVESQLGLAGGYFERARTRKDYYVSRFRGRPVLRTHMDLSEYPPVGTHYAIGHNSQGLLLLVPHPGSLGV